MNCFAAGEKAYSYAKQHGITKLNHYILVDFSVPSNEVRLYAIDNSGRVVFQTYCAHGSGSGKGAIAKRFSNAPNSRMSSIGVYLTGERYDSPKFKHARKVDGQESTNNNARNRAIVIHESSYVGAGKTGNSWGCFAVPESEIEELLKLTPIGTLLVAYYPDPAWLATSKFLRGQ